MKQQVRFISFSMAALLGIFLIAVPAAEGSPEQEKAKSTKKKAGKAKKKKKATASKKEDKAALALKKALESYKQFITSAEYPDTLKHWENKFLLRKKEKEAQENQKLVISIPQQRARYYIDGNVAMDFAVSTGAEGHQTPTGLFRIMVKEEQHYSKRYGRYLNADGKATHQNADLQRGKPDGHSFEAACYPYWLGITPDGVGLHAGEFEAGKPSSRGTIYVQPAIASKLFNDTALRMPVYITNSIEDYSNGGAVAPEDLKYRPAIGNDYTDYAPSPSQIKVIPVNSPEAQSQL